KDNTKHLGLAGCMYFLRFNGWDAFILSTDVVKALNREKVISGTPHSRANLKAVQSAFNKWTSESKRPQREVSRILALSVGPSA
ncbi:MAG: DNA-3-methyladenine glycosylase I, partial [Pseudomonadota bacterium]